MIWMVGVPLMCAEKSGCWQEEETALGTDESEAEEAERERQNFERWKENHPIDSRIINKAALEELRLPVVDSGGRGVWFPARIKKKDLERVTYLNLGSTKITDEELKELTKFPNLKGVWLKNTDVTDAAKAELKKAFPNLTITD